ncbi:MAG TPA: four helix bundle protein [Bacteroidota bacterium]|nr:four helix bundle protein [Bacteroidota bacterium]
MKENNAIQTKSYLFALRIVKLCKWLADQKRETTLSKQLLRSGTSVGANVEEAIGAQSKKEFAAKIRISYKEARETYFWLRLLQDTGYLSIQQCSSIRKDCEELLKILTSILKTMQSSH